MSDDDLTSAEVLAKNNSVRSLPWRPHEGPPIWTPEKALEAFHKREGALSRTVMTEEQRAEYVGDGKSS